ncbi:hypothetical protein DAPPUDRAFT_322887 [Daphnia pulex]|uniref:Uncharacterized protein n=1 Tax=Daphnia pulex TaxID=6669 RepID=E9GX81_DAPPU|nr:hypothetical protein DAPPUDRAFT_322887 [Daphnia pulex]|eukprot:EFX75825.1 hypothetical protein DAPPUDRAFT_322887 [Daphnia pulex]
MESLVKRHWYEVTGMESLLSASLGFVLDVTALCFTGICFRRHWYEVTGMESLLSASLGFVLDVTGMKSLVWSLWFVD